MLFSVGKCLKTIALQKKGQISSVLNKVALTDSKGRIGDTYHPQKEMAKTQLFDSRVNKTTDTHVMII